MRRISWQKNIRTWVTTFGITMLTGFGGQSLMTSSVVVAAEDLVKDAATVEEIAKVLDLRTLPVMEGAKLSDSRQLGTLTYEIETDLKKSFEFHQKQFLKLGWKEMPGSRSEAAYVTTNFQKSNFVVTVMSYAGEMPEKSKSSRVFINNLGNVRLNKLPIVKGAKSLYSGDAGVSYTTDLKLADASETTRKLLLDAGWESYGFHDNPPDSVIHTFKRNAIKLVAFVSIAPAQGGKVAVSLSESVMSADIPAPPNAENVVFSDSTKSLDFMTADSGEDVAKFYQQRFAKLGWKSPTDNAITTDGKFKRTTTTQYFRNEAKDLLSLNVQRQEGAHEGRGRVRLTHVTATELAAAEKREKEAAEKLIVQNKAREDAAAEKSAAQKDAKKKTPKSVDGFPDVDALIKGAVGDALKDGDVDVEKLTKGLNAKIKDAAKDAAKDAGKSSAKEVVSIPIPDNVKKVEQPRENVLQIKLPAGKGQAGAELIRDQMLAADWESSDDDKTTAKSGHLTLKKGRQQLTMSYVDTGFGDVNLMLIGFAVKLEQGKVDPNAKVPVASSKPKSKPKADDDSPDDEPKPTKKTAKKKPMTDSREVKAEVKPVVEPKRVEKPSRGIAKLSKLSNEAKVVANDEPIALPHLIAYEVISDNRWVTKVVATEKPIKQASLLALLQKTGTDEGLEIASPRITLELDDQDRPDKMSYTAPQTIGSANSSGLTGEAIVEEGRARGTFKSKKASEFFGRTITGEISFDLPVLTRHAKPTKQLTDAPKLENSGKLMVNDKPVKLGSVVAYQVKVFDDVRTAILFTEKPINMEKLKASLKKEGNDSGLFEFQSQVKVEINKDDQPSMMSLWHDNASLNSNSDLVGDVIVEDGRARGTVKLGKPSEFIGKTFGFEITFDVEVLPLPTE
ncbi:MAG: hypothetical protein NT013_21705 [Planctomycetia bacterium]|nr:hypothetical protein [Planctomycetia bacterium]